MLTPRQLEAVRALVSEGNGKAAAYSLRMSYGGFRHLLSGVHRRLGCDSTTTAIYLLTLRGELRVPERE